MLKIIISGCNGHMGKVVSRIAAEDPEIQIVAGFDINTAADDGFPVFADPAEFSGRADVLIDFSHPSALDGILACCKANGIWRRSVQYRLQSGAESTDSEGFRGNPRFSVCQHVSRHQRGCGFAQAGGLASGQQL
jgi:hypothetical protein